MTTVTAMPFVHEWSKALSTDGRLTSSDISVARALALHMGSDGGSCYPTHARVAFEVRLKETTVRRSILHLRRYGWLEQLGRSAPGRAASYAARIPEVPAEHRAVEPAVHRAVQPAVANEHRAVEPITPGRTARPGVHQVSITDRAAVDIDFAAVWEHYPRRIARKAALAAYRARRREGVAADELIAATRNYAATRIGQDTTFTMHGATFFGPAERWRDYLVPVAADPFAAPEVVYK